MTLHIFSEKDVAEKPAAMGPSGLDSNALRYASQRMTPSTENFDMQNVIDNIENQSLTNQGNFMSMSNGFNV